jgi:hypothetical protein
MSMWLKFSIKGSSTNLMDQMCHLTGLRYLVQMFASDVILGLKLCIRFDCKS